MDLHYADGIAATRTTLALQANPAALQRRLPSGWELAPYSGNDLRGRALRGANLLVPFHEVYATRTHHGQAAAGLLTALTEIPHCCSPKFPSERPGALPV